MADDSAGWPRAAGKNHSVRQVHFGYERGFVIGEERLVRGKHGRRGIGMQPDQPIDRRLVKRAFVPAIGQYVRIKSNAEIFQQQKPCAVSAA